MRKVWLIVLLLLPLIAQAQHFFEAGFRGGIADWNASTYYVSPVPNLHAGLDLAYHYRSPRAVGFRTGLTIDRHSAAFGKQNYTDSYQTIDVDDQLMQIDYTIGYLNERYTFWSVGIPLQLSFTWDAVSLAVGPKFVFPLVASWHEQVDHAALSVYYPDYDNRVFDSYPLAASPDFSMSEKGTLYRPTVQYWLSSELSYNVRLNTYSTQWSMYLSVGLYVDYSFTAQSIEPNDAVSLITLTDTRDGLPLQRVLSPVLTSTYHASTDDPHRLVSRCSLFDLGIKIAVSFAPYNPLRPSHRPCNCL